MNSWKGLLKVRATRWIGRRTLIRLPPITVIHNERVVDKVVYPPYDIQVPNKKLTDLLWEEMDLKGHLPAMTCAISERTLSHGEVQEQALKLSNTMQGMSDAKTIGLLLPNCIEYAGIVSGTFHAGSVLTPLNPVYTPTEIAKQLQAANVNILFADSAQREKVNASLALCPGHAVHTVVFVHVEGSGDANGTQTPLLSPLPGVNQVVPFESFLSSTPASASCGPEVDPHATALLPFSSGTTGDPKGVELSQHHILTQAVCNSGVDCFLYMPFANFQDVTVAVLPMFHIFGLAITLAGSLHAGVRQVTIPRFDPGLYIKCVEKYSPTFLHVVPPLVSFLANHPAVKPQHLSSLRQVSCGAAPCGEALIRQFNQKAPRVLFREGWGMTEVTGGAMGFHGSYQEYTPGSVNLLCPNIRARVVDPVTNTSLPPNKSGELQIKGDIVMKGYFNNPQATQEAFTQDGWLRTGDIGHYTNLGLFFLSDRMKELIKVKGMQVAPAELENTLRQLEGVRDVAVIGVDDAKAGQVPRAFIVRDESLTEDQIHDWMSLKLAPHKQLAGGVVFTDSIPKSAAGKILKKELFGK